MSKNNMQMSCWIITEGMAGTENQCLGVAEALGVDADVKRIQLHQPWKSLSPWLGMEQSWSFTPALKAPWPDLLIASGRKSIAAARYIRRASKGQTFTVQIQDPRTPPAHFDLLAVPAHDPARGDNVVVTDAAPNRITTEKLEQARHQFQAFEKLGMPRVAVLIGGNSKAHRLTAAVTENLAQQLVQLQAGLMVTMSRRTGAESESILHRALKDTDSYIWDGQGDNPYFGMLAWADYILVTADSVSMISDAATTGKPVYMIPLKGGSPRFDRFHNHLIEKGALRVFEGTLEHWSYPALKDADKIAKEVTRRLKNRSGALD